MCAIIPVVENFLGRIEFLAEFYEIIDTLVVQVESLYEQISLPLTGKREFDEIDDLSW